MYIYTIHFGSSKNTLASLTLSLSQMLLLQCMLFGLEQIEMSTYIYTYTHTYAWEREQMNSLTKSAVLAIIETADSDKNHNHKRVYGLAVQMAFAYLHCE